MFDFREERKKKDYTIATLSYISGVAPHIIGELERNKKPIKDVSFENFYRIAKALDKDPNTLIKEEFYEPK